MADATDIIVNEEETTEETPVEFTPMEEFIARIKAKTIAYGVKVSDLSVELAIEHLKLSATIHILGMKKRNSLIWKIIKLRLLWRLSEIDSKDGAEGQNSHSEKWNFKNLDGFYYGIQECSLGFADIF